MVFQQKICLDYFDLNSSIVAPATQLDITQAIHIIRCSIPDTNHIKELDRYIKLTNGSSIDSLPGQSAKYIQLIDSSGVKIDDCMMLYFKAPISQTGETILEFFLHGSPQLSKRALAFISSIPGFRLALPGEFHFRAKLNGKVSLEKALETAEIFENNLQKKFISSSKHILQKQLQDLISSIRSFLIILESSIDFEEVDVPSDEKIVSFFSDIKSKIFKILTQAKSQRQRLEATKIVILGPPNAGKSSLFNSLVGFDCAIVSPIPGTTRDIVQAHWSFNGYNFLLMDCAGIRDTDDLIEKTGINKALEEAKRADIVIYCSESYSFNDSLSKDFIRLVDLFVLTKQDSLNSSQNFLKNEIGFSIHDSRLIENFKLRILDIFESKFSTEESNLSLYQWQENFLEKAHNSIDLDEIRLLLSNLGNLDILSSKIRRVEELLSSLNVQVNRQDMLVDIFSTFCIGK